MSKTLSSKLLPKFLTLCIETWYMWSTSSVDVDTFVLLGAWSSGLCAPWNDEWIILSKRKWSFFYTAYLWYLWCHTLQVRTLRACFVLCFRFIGELFKLKMLTENIMHDCVFKLLRTKDPENLECLCRLLTTIGKELDTEKAKVCRPLQSLF